MTNNAAKLLNGITLEKREKWRPKVVPLLEPGEQLQVVIEASNRRAEGVLFLMEWFWPFFFTRHQFLLIATDRAWVVLKSAHWAFRGELTLIYRGPRDVVIEYSWLRRFDKFDQPYSIDPIFGESVSAANSALEAARRGEKWDLAAIRSELDAVRPDPAAKVIAEVFVPVFEASVPILSKLPKRPRWVRWLQRDE